MCNEETYSMLNSVLRNFVKNTFKKTKEIGNATLLATLADQAPKRTIKNIYRYSQSTIYFWQK